MLLPLTLLYDRNKEEPIMITTQSEQRNPEVESYEVYERNDEVRHTTSFIEILCQSEDALDKLDKCTYNSFGSFDADFISLREATSRTVQFDDNIVVRMFDKVSPEDKENIFYTKRELHEFQLQYIEEAISQNQSTLHSFKQTFLKAFLCCGTEIKEALNI